MDAKSKYIWERLHLHSYKLQVRRIWFCIFYSSIRIGSHMLNIYQYVFFYGHILNDSLHWSLIVVCHPGEIPYFTGKFCVCMIMIFFFKVYFVWLSLLMVYCCPLDEETKKASKVPCILHMDSIKGSHRGLKNLFQRWHVCFVYVP